MNNTTFKKGNTPWNKGKKCKSPSKSTREKMSESHKGMTGKTHSEETKQKIRESKLGKFGNQNNNWKGGITPLNHMIRNSSKNKAWKHDIFERDNYTCQECGERGIKFNAHHIKTVSKIIEEYNIKNLKDAYLCEELWFLENGITLCVKCHKQLHRGKK